MNNCSVAMIVKNKEAIPAWVFQELSHHNIQLNARKCRNTTDFWETASDADIIWLAGHNRFITPEVLSRLPQCGAILRTGSGVNDIPVNVATKQGILIVNTPDAIAESVAEHTVALLLASIRRIPEQDRGIRRNNDWNDGTFRPAHHLKGSTLGLISFGRIARRVAEMLSGFHLEILAHDPLLSDEFIRARGVKPCGLQELLQQSDFVSLHCPLTDKTRHLISEKELCLMKPNAILLNTARGAIIDESALIKALQQGDIVAALDVLEEEPPQQDNPLLKLDNVILTPHIAAFSDQFEENYWKYSVETIIDLSRKCWPSSVVNPQLTPKWIMNNKEDSHHEN